MADWLRDILTRAGEKKYRPGKVAEKYSADQPRDPAGSSTGGQWTSTGERPGATVSSSTDQRGPGISTAHFDERGEADLLINFHGMSGTLKPGVTREQSQRYFNRLDAVKKAAQIHYRGSPQTIAQAVDDAIASGMTEYSASSRWTTLTNPANGNALRFGIKEERDYINVALNRGNMKRNY